MRSMSRQCFHSFGHLKRLRRLGLPILRPSCTKVNSQSNTISASSRTPRSILERLMRVLAELGLRCETIRYHSMRWSKVAASVRTSSSCSANGVNTDTYLSRTIGDVFHLYCPHVICQSYVHSLTT